MPLFWPFGWDRVILEDYRGSPRPLPRPSSAHAVAVDALRETDRSGTREGGDGSAGVVPRFVLLKEHPCFTKKSTEYDKKVHIFCH